MRGLLAVEYGLHAFFEATQPRGPQLCLICNYTLQLASSKTLAASRRRRRDSSMMTS